MKIYVAGPMSGRPRWNFDAFAQAAAELRALGYDVVSPAELDLADGFDPDAVLAIDPQEYERLLMRSLGAMLQCDAVALLPGYETSRGARLEIEVARGRGLYINTLQSFTERKHTND